MLEVLICSQNNKHRKSNSYKIATRRKAVDHKNRSGADGFMALSTESTVHTGPRLGRAALLWVLGVGGTLQVCKGQILLRPLSGGWGESVGGHSSNPLKVTSLWTRSWGSLKQVRVLSATKWMSHAVPAEPERSPPGARSHGQDAEWPRLVLSVTDALEGSRHLFSSRSHQTMGDERRRCLLAMCFGTSSNR